MSSININQVLNFVFLIALQVLVLDNIELHRLIRPLIYPLIILLLPISLPGALVIIISMVLGLVIDVFNDTLGLHASACVFMAFCRPFVLSIFRPRGGYEQFATPSYQKLGLNWFLRYVGLSIVLFNAFFFMVEAFSFRFIHLTILKIILSSFFCLLLILIHQMLFARTKVR